MAYLTVDEQVEAITHTAITGLGMSHAAVQAMIAKRDGDRLALNRLRVKLNTTYRTRCREMDRTADDKLLAQYATEGSARHLGFQEEAARLRRLSRDKLTPGQRVDKALAELAALSTVGALVIDAVRVSGVATATDPPSADARTEHRDISALLAGLRYLTEQLEVLLDAEKGLLPPHELARLPGDVKDHVILTQLVGVHCDTISEAMPWLGSSRSIRRLRAEHGQRIDGTDRKAAA